MGTDQHGEVFFGVFDAILCSRQHFCLGHFLVVGFLGLREAAFTFGNALGYEHGIDAVVVYDFGGVAVDLVDLDVVELDVVDHLYDLAADFVELLEVGRFLNEFAPELLVELGRGEHGLLAEHDVVVEADDFDEVALLVGLVLELVLDDLLEAVDDKLLDEGGRQLLGHDELFVGLGLVVLPLHVEERERDMEFGAGGELLDALLVHPLDLQDQQVAVLVHFGQQRLFLPLLDLDGAVVLDAGLNVLLYVAHQQHVGVGIFFAIVDQL